MWDLVIRAYAPLDYEDFFEIREQQLANERSGADLIYIVYDVVDDNFPTGIYGDGIYLHDATDVIEEEAVGTGIDSGWPIKYDIITWDEHENWRRETSVQRLPPE